MGFFQETRGEPCPGSRELERRALDGESLRRALKKGGPRLEWKGRKDDERSAWQHQTVKLFIFHSRSHFSLYSPEGRNASLMIR
ncbi:hypothetical protein TNCV_1512861 [Trichonephila clavipes]|nr:hypothetical protein TNCV_1512861 [Trichonephila clavipes]